jgi:hypothetical protein
VIGEWGVNGASSFLKETGDSVPLSDTGFVIMRNLMVLTISTVTVTGTSSLLTETRVITSYVTTAEDISGSAVIMPYVTTAEMTMVFEWSFFFPQRNRRFSAAI